MFGVNGRDDEHGGGAEAPSFSTPRVAGEQFGVDFFRKTRKPRYLFPFHTHQTHSQSAMMKW